MKILNSKISNKIYTEMSTLDLETLINSDNYIIKCVSVFDHWLTEVEARDQVMFYGEVEDQLNTLPYLEYLNFEIKFLKFYLNLFNELKVYGILYSEEGSSKLIEFDSIEEYKSHVLLSIREQLFLKIVVPDLYTVIVGGHDLTHLIYILKSKSDSLNVISKLVFDNGLFILD